MGRDSVDPEPNDLDFKVERGDFMRKDEPKLSERKGSKGPKRGWRR